MPWCELSCVLPRDLADAVSEFLEAQGAIAITFAEDGDEALFEPLPGEMPLWRSPRLTALFELGVNPEAIQADLAARFGDKLTGWRRQILADRPWERVWLEHFKPLNFGRLWVCPSGQSPPDPNAVYLTLDPGLAFGTGTHPTTALCLRWLAAHPLSGKSVIDYGCGSGILAVAALVLGASEALACDLDPQALTATQENARKNQVAARLRCCYPEAMPQVAADLVLANILADALIALAPTLAAHTRPGGWLILSGILESQAEAVKRAYPGFAFRPPAVEDGWVLLAGQKQ
nr:ribosomal protein L11 methyltransferase [uncultured Gammaproteobacteria bacterium]